MTRSNHQYVIDNAARPRQMMKTVKLKETIVQDDSNVKIVQGKGQERLAPQGHGLLMVLGLRLGHRIMI